MERLAELKKRLEEGCPGLELREDEPMSRHTTFRIGGPAALMALPRTAGEAKAAVNAARGGQPIVLPDRGVVALQSSSRAKIFGWLVVAATVALYIIFW